MKPLNIIYIPGKRCPQRDNSQQWMQKKTKKAETTIITVRDIAPAQQGQETNALRIQQIVENSNLHKRKTMLDFDQ